MVSSCGRGFDSLQLHLRFAAGTLTLVRVLSAFDSAMRSLIVAIYQLGVQEIMVVAHSHCGACHMSFDHFHHEMIEGA